jgi:hypothetical protein
MGQFGAPVLNENTSSICIVRRHFGKTKPISIRRDRSVQAIHGEALQLAAIMLKLMMPSAPLRIEL